MQSIKLTAYSTKAKDVLQYESNAAKPDVNKLKSEDVLVRVHASSINYGDRVLMSGQPWLARLMLGVFKPAYRPGCDFAGKVVAIGDKVTSVSVGDCVFGDSSDISPKTCGGFAAWSDYVVCAQGTMAKKPTNLTFLEAACIPSAGATALQAVRDHGKLQAGEEVMIHGAGGGVGHFALQISKALGAKSVAAYTSGAKVEQAKQLGADTAFNYKAVDFVKEGTKYDLIVDSGAYRSLYDIKTAMQPELGKYVFCGGSTWRLLDVSIRGPWIRNKKQIMTNFLVKPNTADLNVLAKMAEDGKLKPHVETVVPSLNKVPEAMSDYMERGAGGKIGIAIFQADQKN